MKPYKKFPPDPPQVNLGLWLLAAFMAVVTLASLAYHAL